MTRLMRLLLPLTILFAAAPAFPQERRTEHTVRRTDGAPPSAATLADVTWLAGRWEGEGLGGRVEEIWSAPDGGAMMGIFRLIRDERPVFYEFLTIRETDRGLAMQLKHFNPDMTGWEEREKFVEFLHVQTDGNRVLFEGLTFEREGNDSLTIYLALRGKDGSVREHKFSMRRKS